MDWSEGSCTCGQGLAWCDLSFCAKGRTPRLSYQLAQTKGGQERGKGEAHMLSAITRQKVE